MLYQAYKHLYTVVELPEEHFNLIQKETQKSEKNGSTRRQFNPGRTWGIPDIFQDKGEL